MIINVIISGTNNVVLIMQTEHIPNIHEKIIIEDDEQGNVFYVVVSKNFIIENKTINRIELWVEVE